MVSSISEDRTSWFCGKVHLIEWIAPELKNACVPRQWIPTPEAEERMSQ
jgi:hypothetical protein